MQTSKAHLVMAGLIAATCWAEGLSAQQGTTLPILDAPSLTASCSYVLDGARKRADAIAQMPMSEVSVETVLDQWDRNSIYVEDVIGPVAILANVHPNPDVRSAAEECLQETSRQDTELYQNEALYQRIAAVETTDPVAAKLKEDLLESFEDTGVNLPPAKRERAKEISDRLTELTQEFERNLRDDNSELVFTPEEYEGVPEGYLAGVKHDGDNIVVGMSSPEYIPFMRNSLNEDARRRYYIAYLNVAAPRNLEILNEISTLRRELAELHGQPSYAEYIIRRRMAGSRVAVADFLADVQRRAEVVELGELAQIRALKAELTGTPVASTRLNHWDLGFYRERLRERKFDIDQEAIRQYFPARETLDWALLMSSRLYDVEFEEREVPKWHPDVRYFDVSDKATGEYLGGLYIDAYPRDGKYTHAAVWPVRHGSTLDDRRPISVLVTNLNPEGLLHSEVETMLHELGHALHNIFSQTRYSLHAGTSVERDFVEGPSQMYEEWARRPETLALIREVCEECPQIEPELVERLNAARRFGLGLTYADQRRLAALDQGLTGGEPSEVTALWRSIEEDSPRGSVPEANFPAQFGHLANHYGAGYYGYMWSEVIAIDLLSAFDGNLLDPEVGRRFRETILARGGERPAMEMVEDFLGREVSSDAFFDEITGRRVD